MKEHLASPSKIVRIRRGRFSPNMSGECAIMDLIPEVHLAEDLSQHGTRDESYLATCHNSGPEVSMTTVRLETETVTQLKAFLGQALPAQAFEAWIVSVIDEMPDEEADELWQLRLLLTEVGEGLRPLADAITAATNLLNQLTVDTFHSDAGTSTSTFDGASISTDTVSTPGAA
jgi:hypothetical protein